MVAGTPTAISLVCPRCKILRRFGAVDGGTLFRCSACEWYWTFSTQAPTGTTNAQSGLGSSPFLPVSLPVASGGASFTNGMLLLVGAGSAAEVVQVNGTPTGTSIPVTEASKIVSTPPVPAAVTTPAVPASTVVQANTTGFDVSVVITGGTMTNVSVGGFTVGAGAGTYVVPAGSTISMTYSVAPTWVWSGRVPVQSQYWHPVYAVVTGGTLTRNTFVSQVPGGPLVDQSATTGTFLIPPYCTIQIQYSAAPTWVWNAPMGKLHANASAIGQLLISSTLGGVGQDAVPGNPPYGF
jgi:hypothetical protein